MEKKQIVRFLKSKKRGIYTLIVELYSDAVKSMATTMVLEIIRDDLERECGHKVELNYHSLAKAVARFRKKRRSKLSGEKQKWQFPDASEIPDSQLRPGKFTIG